jgi:hypothetical protein
VISLEHLVRFGLGMMVVGAIYAAARVAHLYLTEWKVVQALLRARSHFALAGFVAALAFPSGVRQEISVSMEMAAHLIGAWLAFSAGSTLDRRAFRQTTISALILESTQFLLCTLLALGISYAAIQTAAIEGAEFTMPVVVALAAVVGFGRKTFGRSAKVQHGGISVETTPMIAAAAAAVLFAVAAILMRGGDIVIRAPFAPTGRVLMIEGAGMELILTVFLGSLLGLAADLLTRDCPKRSVFFLLILCLMFGGGIAAVCGLEPIGVGLVAAVWLINTTLRRLDILRALTAGGPPMRGGIYFVAGFLLGEFLPQGFDAPTAFYVFLAMAAIRPVAAMGALVAARQMLAMPTLRSMHVSSETYFGSSELALAAAVLMGYLLPVPVGVSIVAAVMAAQWFLAICNELLREREFFNRAGTPAVQPLSRPRL